MSEAKIENTLFNDKKMEEFIQLYDDVLNVNADCDPISYWIEKLENDELQNERNNYLTFFKIILEKILGYKLTDLKFEEDIGNEGKPVEFTLKKGDKDYVVVELKGTKCKDLTQRYNREQSPVEQVTNYASAKEETQWAFVSNYNEFRFFNPSYREKYISFKFKQLTDPNILKKFLLIFSKFSLIDKDIPQTLLKETKIIEKDLEDEFYKLFSETRLMLIKELEYSSEDIDRIEAIRLAQLILNRYIFLCFAEDLLLIPTETTADTILTPIKHNNLFDFIMWDRLNALFRYADKGNEEKGISAFNGGFFEEDLKHLEIRDKIKDEDFFEDCYQTANTEEKYESIKDKLGSYKDTLNPIYKNLLLISRYDFGSELDVNILGHIFENSIGDIEELKDKTTERRKKEGVFYTPEYITNYICRNTIIPYLSISGEAKTTHELISEYEYSNSLDELDKKLKDIKIIDISCGSGAFLNKAVDVLFEIHEALHTSKYEKDETLNKYFDSLDSRKQIISNNIYGVDLNEESVEITKLSLFLKLATSSGVKEGFKLPNLNKNIKCGNSIIDDKNIVGKKAFSWKEEFNEVFDEGGFDIVIGNPPYITPALGKKQKTLSDMEIDFISKNFKSYEYKGNTYVIFIEKGLDILKEDGILSYITPNTLLTNYYYKEIRKILVDKSTISKLIEINGKIFKDAETGGNLISIIKKSICDSNTKIISFEDPKLLLNLNDDDFDEVNIQKFNEFDDVKFLMDTDKLDLILKLKNMGINLENEEYFTIYQGIITGNNKKFLSNTPIDENYIKILRGSDIYRYAKKFNSTYILFDKTQLHSNHDEKIFLTEEKIISRQTSDKIIATYDNEQFFSLDSTHILISKKINTKYILGIYNSKLINFYYQTIVPEIGKTFPQVKAINLKQLPIILPNNNEKQSIISNVDTLLELNQKLIDMQYTFRNWLDVTYNCGEISNRNKLFNFWELEEKEFFTQLQKKIGKISVKNYELIKHEFNDLCNEINKIYAEINLTNSQLDSKIYELYDLTVEEIAIIENSLND